MNQHEREIEGQGSKGSLGFSSLWSESNCLKRVDPTLINWIGTTSINLHEEDICGERSFLCLGIILENI